MTLHHAWWLVSEVGLNPDCVIPRHNLPPPHHTGCQEGEVRYGRAHPLQRKAWQRAAGLIT